MKIFQQKIHFLEVLRSFQPHLAAFISAMPNCHGDRQTPPTDEDHEM